MAIKRIFGLALLALLCSCRGAAPEKLENGDLIFVGISMDYSLDHDSMDNAIASATGDGGGLNLIHAAIVEVDRDGAQWIIDATIKRGVDRHPLDTFLRDFTLRDGSLPVFEVKRLKDTTGVAGFVKKARTFLGESYNSSFVPTPGAHYCTELIRDSYVPEGGSPLFDEAPMNFRAPDGSMTVYWEQMFALLEMEVPQGVPGTNPQDMSRSPLLKAVPISVP